MSCLIGVPSSPYIKWDINSRTCKSLTKNKKEINAYLQKIQCYEYSLHSYNEQRPLITNSKFINKCTWHRPRRSYVAVIRLLNQCSDIHLKNTLYKHNLDLSKNTHCCDFHFGRCVLRNLADHVESPVRISKGHIVPRRNLLTCSVEMKLLMSPLKSTAHCSVVYIL